MQSKRQKSKVIIDCDPGQDDALALIMAKAASDELDVLGITTVAGNVQLKMTQRNARLICEKIGFDSVPVYAGCSRPMMRELVTAEEYHGENGLNGIELYEPEKKLESQHAVGFIIETLEKAEDDSISIVAIGPLTNIGAVIVQKPGLLKKVKEIVIMGGSFIEGGNVTAAAEFNFYVDPHAVDVVLNCGRPLIIFGLDATHQARVTAGWRERIEAMPETEAVAILKTSVDYFNKAYKDIYDQDAAPIHDVLTVAYLIAPNLFRGINTNVRVETSSELTMGASIVDQWMLEGRPENALWITEVDTDGFFELLLERVGRL